MFNLGSWQASDDELGRWMTRVLCAPTGPVPGATAQVEDWVQQGRIAPFLDGLDEITDPALRHRCVVAINRFLDATEPRVAVVVASRPAEYTDISSDGADRLAVNAAIELCPLRPTQIADHLRDAASSDARALGDFIDQNPTSPLAQALAVPLWLSLIALGAAPAVQLRAAATPRQANELLVEGFVALGTDSLARALAQPTATCRRWLGAIAGFLTDPAAPDHTTFFLEDLTGRHPSRLQLVAFGLISGLISGLIFGLMFGLMFRLMFRLIFGLIFGLAYGLAYGPIFGLIYGLAYGLFSGLGFGLVVVLDEDGWYLLLQWQLRRRARRQGLLPQDPVRLLDAAIATGLLRQTGGGVQFRHRAILDHSRPTLPPPASPNESRHQLGHQRPATKDRDRQLDSCQ